MRSREFIAPGRNRMLADVPQEREPWHETPKWALWRKAWRRRIWLPSTEIPGHLEGCWEYASATDFLVMP